MSVLHLKSVRCNVAEMELALQTTIRNILRGISSTLVIQPNTRLRRANEIRFGKYVLTVSGRNVTVDASPTRPWTAKSYMEQIGGAFISDWARISADLENSTLKLPAETRLHAIERFANRRRSV